MIGRTGSLPATLSLNRRNSFRRRLATGVLCLVLIGLAIWGTNTYQNQLNSPHAVAGKAQISDKNKLARLNSIQRANSPSPATFSSKELQAAIQKVITAHPELTIGVSFIDLNSGTKVNIGGNQSFTAASTTKILTACLFLKGVENGTYSLDQPLGSYTAGYQLEQMVNQSNNDSWNYLNDLLSLSAQQDYAHQLGLNSYDSTTNSFSSNDMASLLQQLYTGKLLSDDDTQLLLSYMQNTNEESLIPAGLPASATVYHKYGELDDNVHDAAIIENGDTSYILAIYSNGHGYYNYDQRADMMHEIEKAVNTTLHAPTL